ncbi:MAG TPA: pyridine nucleotide-disulfide oxidoreductase, partial [Ignavibacteria bacterium]|nr:pyridine nucleotide-disulfide oxidoreductase [Ignavibacteria bacterium]
MITPKKIIIVGGNAAGAAAAAKSKRINPQASVILFEASDYISTGTCEIPYVISGEISSYQNIVYYTAQKFFEEKGVRVFVNHLVESINRKEKFISVKDLKSSESKIYNYDTLVLSTGSSAKRLPDLLNNPKNIFTLKNIQDLKNIIDYSRITNV